MNDYDPRDFKITDYDLLVALVAAVVLVPIGLFVLSL